MVAGDFDGDGDEDIVLTDAAQELLLLANVGGQYRVSHKLTGQSFGNPAAGNLDWDGDLDLVVRRAGDTAVYYNDGSGQFSLGPLLAPSEAAALLDVDGDGDLDVFLFHIDGCTLYFNVPAP